MKRPIFGKKKPQKRKVVDTEEILRKKTHAHIKLIRKASHINTLLSIAVKKSKQFEIQKLVRRLKKASTEPNSKDAANVSKLESVLASLRAADIERLANLAAASVGYNPDGTPAPPAAVAVDDVELLDRKILSANCVTDQLGVMVKALKAIKTKAERQNGKQKEQAGEEKEKNDDGGGEKSERRKAPAGSGSDEENSKEYSEEESEIEPDENALQAIEKLLARKQTGGQRGNGGSSDEEKRDSEESSDDSGVIENVSEQEEDMLADTDFNSNTDDEEKEGQLNLYKVGGGDAYNKGGGAGEVKKKVKAKPKKSKNRLGQRARRQLAGYQPPPQTYGGRNPASRPEDRPGRDNGGGGGGSRDDSKRKRPPVVEVDEGPLHPSWAARRQEKQKLSIVSTAVPPSSKKIVFDDDGSKKFLVNQTGATKPSSTSNPRQPRSTAPSAGKYQRKGSQEEDEGPLHPSWELKKKLNAQKQLVPSQGTKIVFDD